MGNKKGCKLPIRCKVDVNELRRLYVDELWPSDRLGEYYGCSAPTILTRLRSSGVRIRHHNETKRGRHSNNFIAADEEAILSAYQKSGQTVVDVALALGLTAHIVNRVLRARGIRIRSISETRGEKYSGSSNPNWRPDLTPEERATRRDMASQAKWRMKVYERDSFMCQSCGDVSGGNLNAHHIEDHKSNKKARWEIHNGITLCESCHIMFHKLFGYGGNDAMQFAQFLAVKEAAE